MSSNCPRPDAAGGGGVAEPPDAEGETLFDWIAVPPVDWLCSAGVAAEAADAAVAEAAPESSRSPPLPPPAGFAEAMLAKLFDADEMLNDMIWAPTLDASLRWRD